MKRCDWCNGSELYQAYHDKEWGMPLYDEQALFELLILEGMQAGLSWLTVLKKRQNFRLAFDNFSPEIIARYDQAKIQSLLQNEGIIRNRLKIHAVIKNAQAFLDLKAQGKNFADFLWQFVQGKPVCNQWSELFQVPAKTALSDQMSKALSQKGFTFIGSTICYAFMQASGMVNDHLIHCFRYEELTSVINE